MKLNVDPGIAALTDGLAKPGPASADQFDGAGRDLGIAWPEDYRAYMLHAGGGEGWVGKGYIALWPAGQLVENNRMAEIQTFEPHLVGIGTNGGGELFAYDTSGSAPTIVMTPAVDLGSPIRLGTFRDLLARLAVDTLFDPRDIHER